MSETSEDEMTSYLGGKIVDVFVGPKRKNYQVHSDLFNQYPRLKTALLHSEMADGLFRSSVYLPKMNPEIFGLLVNWLYRRTLKKLSPDCEDGAMDQVALYIELYIDAENTYNMPELQNSITDLFRARPTCSLGWFPTEEIGQIYEETSKSSPLRRYIVDTFVFKSYGWKASSNVAERFPKREDKLRAQLDAGNQQFVLDCYDALMETVSQGKIEDPNDKPRCTYHVHEEGEKCD